MPSLQGQFVIKELRMEGISMFNHLSIFPELRKKNIELVKQVRKISPKYPTNFRYSYEGHTGKGMAVGQ